jgi:hypothetical protein
MMSSSHLSSSTVTTKMISRSLRMTGNGLTWCWGIHQVGAAGRQKHISSSQMQSFCGDVSVQNHPPDDDAEQVFQQQHVGQSCTHRALIKHTQQRKQQMAEPQQRLRPGAGNDDDQGLISIMTVTGLWRRLDTNFKVKKRKNGQKGRGQHCTMQFDSYTKKDASHGWFG